MTANKDASEKRARWARDAKALVGEVLGGKYLIEEILGRGGMGTIYAAEQQPLGRKVALKVLHSTLGGNEHDPEFQKRFLLEAAVLAGLAHPNIVVLHDYGTLEDETGACFMVMELLQGQTINDHLKAEERFEPIRALRIAREIARALRAAHAQEVIHRDLKPANVMLCPGAEGEAVKVLDFGLVKVIRDDSEELTQEGRFLGSPRYMSPEQIQRNPMDGRSDLYSLGVILYRMLSGDVPFAGDQAVLTLMAHLHDPYPPIEGKTGVRVPMEIERIVQKLLQKDPNDRFASADELIAAIDRLWPGYSDEPLMASAEYMRPTSGELDALPRVSVVDSSTGDSESMTWPSGPGLAPSALAQAPVAQAPVPQAAPVAQAAPADAAPAGGPWKIALVVAVVCAAALTGAFVVTRLVATEPDPVGQPVAESDEHAPSAEEPSRGSDAQGSDAQGSDAQGSDAQGSARAPDPVGSPEPDPTVEARVFTLRIHSSPSGATVVRDGEEVGETPLEIELDANTLEERPATFTLRMRGRAPFVFTQQASDQDVTVEGELPRIASGRRRRGGGGTSPRPTGGDMSIKTSR